MALEQTIKLDRQNLTVFEAWYGDKDGALTLLQFPPHLREFFLHLSDKADLPDSPPPGAKWEPFVRGSRQDDYYVVSLTSPDFKAVRPGMVATRVLAIPLVDAMGWDLLGMLFEYLRDANRVYKAEHTFSLLSRPPTPEVPPALLSCVAHYLVHETKTVAIIGQSGFDNLIAALWLNLPPQLRQILGFGFSFTPSDLTVSGAHIVTVPESCQVRWREYQFKCNTNWNRALSASAAALLSDASACDFLAFLNTVGLGFNSFLDYGRYARLWDEWQHRSQNDPQIVYALLRSLGTLIPDPVQASAQKIEAMRHAADCLKSAGADGILAQRSVKSEPFPENAQFLGAAIIGRIKVCFSSSLAEDKSMMAKIVSAVPSAQSSAWQAWVRKGLRQALVPLGEVAAAMTWALISEEGAFAEVTAQLPSDAASEETMIRTFPGTLTAPLYPILELWCAERNWLSLLATSAIAHLDFVTTIKLILNYKAGPERSSAIKLLCSTVKPSDIWAAAFEHDDSTLFDSAVSAALMQPSLWTEPAPDLKRWTALLEVAENRHPDFLRKVDMDAVIARLFEAWEHEAPVSVAILESLEKADRLEFTSFSKRERLWSKMPSRFLSAAKDNTLRAWLRNFYLQPSDKPVLENELVHILFEPRHNDAVFPQDAPMLGQGGLLLITVWGNERACEAWLHAIAGSNTKLLADLAGKAGDIVLSHSWRAVARLAKYYDEERGRNDLAPIWRAYYDTLGMLEKFSFDFLQSSSRATVRKQSANSSSFKIDAVFVTALPEEFSAVQAYLSNRREQVEKGTLYEIGQFPTNGVDCTVAVVQTGMGNAPSAAATERALTLFKPSFAFFVGIAGGLRDDLVIGDVIAADKVYGYEGGKAAATFQPRPDMTVVSHEAVQRAYAVVRDNNWHKRIIPSPPKAPSAMVKPIAAGEKLLTSEKATDLRRLRATYTDAHAVAMEEHGFGVAVRGHSNVCFAVVRGISDLIENKAQADRAGSHVVAATNAAAFAFEMLAGLVRARAESRQEENSYPD